MITATIARRRLHNVLAPVTDDEEEPPPYEGTFGPGPNAPAWSGKTIYPEQLFAEPLPISPTSVNGYRVNQGYGPEYEPQRVSYPVIETPSGVKPVHRLTYPGTSELLAVGASSTPYPFRGVEYTNAAIQIEGAHSGSTFLFEGSNDDGETWDPLAVTGYYYTGSESGTSTTVNGTWLVDDGSLSEYKLLRVRRVGGSGLARVISGFQGGQSPARGRWGTYNAGATKCYIRVRARVSADFKHNGASGVKFFFLRTGVDHDTDDGNNHYFLLTEGNPDAYVQPGFGLQPHGGAPASTHRAETTFPLGEWFDMEIEVVLNDPGSVNGICRIWVDDTLVLEETDVEWLQPGDVRQLTYNWFDPTHGGGQYPTSGGSLDVEGFYYESAA